MVLSAASVFVDGSLRTQVEVFEICEIGHVEGALQGSNRPRSTTRGGLFQDGGWVRLRLIGALASPVARTYGQETLIAREHRHVALDESA